MHDLGSAIAHLWHETFLGARGPGASKLPIDHGVVEGHTRRSEALFETPADCLAVEPQCERHGGRGALDVIDDKTGDPVLDDLGDRALAKGDDRGAVRHRFDEDHAERFGPGDRKQQRERVPEK